jgi:hypothetical protein
MHTRHTPLAVLLMLVIAACERSAPSSPSSIASSGLVGQPGRQPVNVETITAGMRQELAALHPLYSPDTTIWIRRSPTATTSSGPASLTRPWVEWVTTTV